MNTLSKPAERTAARTTPSRAPAWATPLATIREEKDAYLLELEMPGVSKDGLEITVENNELTIIGHRSDQEPKGGIVYRETRAIDYRRVFDLDPSIDSGRIAARIDQGVVTVTLPKAEHVKPRKIQVMAE